MAGECVCPHCGQPWEGKHVYTRSEIEKICENPSEYEKHEKAIEEAQNEGRIDYTR
jgi:hypothetical protein